MNRAEGYIPPTELVRHNWGAYGAPREEFDRWLAAHDASVAAEARREALEEAAAKVERLYAHSTGQADFLARAIRALAGGTESETTNEDVKTTSTGGWTAADVRELADRVGAGDPRDTTFALLDDVRDALIEFAEVLSPRPVEPEGQA